MKKDSKGKLFIITGSSGVGKDTVIDLLRQKLNFVQVVTTTTRPMRVGEREGQPYYFISKQKFERMIKNDELFEWAEVYGNYYGNTKKEILGKLENNKIVVLKIDPQGAETVKNKIPRAITIFIRPKNINELRKRLFERGTDSAEVIKKRLDTVKEEMKNLSKWDYVVMNEQGKIDEAVEEICGIIGGLTLHLF